GGRLVYAFTRGVALLALDEAVLRRALDVPAGEAPFASAPAGPGLLVTWLRPGAAAPGLDRLDARLEAGAGGRLRLHLAVRPGEAGRARLRALRWSAAPPDALAALPAAALL